MQLFSSSVNVSRVSRTWRREGRNGKSIFLDTFLSRRRTERRRKKPRWRLRYIFFFYATRDPRHDEGECDSTTGKPDRTRVVRNVIKRSDYYIRSKGGKADYLEVGAAPKYKRCRVCTRAQTTILLPVRARRLYAHRLFPSRAMTNRSIHPPIHRPFARAAPRASEAVALRKSPPSGNYSSRSVKLDLEFSRIPRSEFSRSAEFPLRYLRRNSPESAL